MSYHLMLWYIALHYAAGWELFDASVKSCEKSVEKSELILRNGAPPCPIPPAAAVRRVGWAPAGVILFPETPGDLFSYSFVLSDCCLVLCYWTAVCISLPARRACALDLLPEPADLAPLAVRVARHGPVLAGLRGEAPLLPQPTCVLFKQHEFDNNTTKHIHTLTYNTPNN